MTSVLKKIAQFYSFVVYDLSDDKTKHLPLMQSPVPVITIIAVYLLFVYKLGPMFMKHRNPYNLKKTLINYNVFQIIYCIGIIINFTRHVPFSEWKCTSLQYTNSEMIYGGYAYFVLKIIDLLDTVFFILKKNYRQVTFLHVYHHSTMVIFMWIGMKNFAGGQSIFLPFVNSIVHVIMYGYYLLTVYDDKYKKSIWWKKHITQLQLFQFGLLTVMYTTPLIYDCGYPKVLCLFTLLFNAVIIGLFGNFYYKTYIRKIKNN